MRFDALILAGGKSSRMGRDKAGLELNGRTLLAHQIAVARALGAATVFISGRAGVDYARQDCPLLYDAWPEAGPLAGIERGLAGATTPLLLILAIDLPHLQRSTLHRLAAACRANCGAVPFHDGRPEPLAAFYPRSAHALAVQALANGHYAVGDFVAACQTAKLVEPHALRPEEIPEFANWNTPADLPSGRSQSERPHAPAATRLAPLSARHGRGQCHHQ